MGRSLGLTWSNESMASLYAQAAAECKCDFDVYVESLDGNTDPGHVHGLLENWNILVEGAQVPIIANVDRLPALLADEDYFPHHDTVWGTVHGNQRIEVPEFMTFYAAENVGGRPYRRVDYAHEYPDWSIVENWMRENSIIFGVSQALLSLLIQYKET